MLFISFRGKDDLLGMYCYFPVILLVNFVKVAPVIVVTLQKGLCQSAHHVEGKFKTHFQ